MDPYNVTLRVRPFGIYRVEVMHDLAWAVIFVNGTQYQCQGNNDGWWLECYEDDGRVTSRPLQWVLEMICFQGNPDRVDKEPGRFDHWLKTEGQPIVAAWRDALARAKYFWEHPPELSDAIHEEIEDRYAREKNHSRRLVFETFIRPSERARLGVEEPTPLRKGGDLHVPF